MALRLVFRGTWRAAAIGCLASAWLLLPAQQQPVISRGRMDETWWKDRHEHCLRMTKYGHSDVVFLGDSITQGWEDTGEQVWDSEISPYKASNFGFSGDRTDHVLWRLQDGEIFGMKPKVVVVMIGTNNLTFGENPEQTAAGVRDVVRNLEDGLPNSKVLLLGIFPRGEKPDDAYRQRVSQTNELLKGSADGKHVVYLDISPEFLSSDGTLTTTLFPDGLHPSEDGYKIWARAMGPELNALLKR